MKMIKSLLPVSIVNLIVLFFVTLKLPDIIPRHWTYEMVADGFGSKWIIMFVGVFPIIASVVSYFAFRAAAKHDPYKGAKVVGVLLPIVVAFIIIITWLPVYLAMTYDAANPVPVSQIPIDIICYFLAGVLIIVVSNYIGVMKYNPKILGFVMGIRTPWTMKSETVWKKTHRLGAYAGIIGGIIMCVSSLLGLALNERLVAVAGVVLGFALLIVVPTVYSYLLYKKEING